MQNNGQKPLDVTILLVGADFSIAPLWPVDGADNRIAIGESRTIDLVQNVPDGTRPATSGLSWSLCRASASRIWPLTILVRKGCAVGRTRMARPPAARALMAVGLNDMDRAATSQPPRIEEEISISIEPFYVGE